jgi:hypothetical protein
MVTVEKIEEGKVTIEIATASGFRNQLTIDRAEFDGDIKEGDVLSLEYGHYKTDETATKIRRVDLNEKKERIINKSLRKKRNFDEIL